MDAPIYTFWSPEFGEIDCIHERDAAKALGMSVAELRLRGLDCIAEGRDQYPTVAAVKAEIERRGLIPGEIVKFDEPTFPGAA